MHGICRLPVTANRLFVGLLIAAGAMIACSGTTISCPAGGPAVIELSLAYPIPNATNVPVNLGVVILSGAFRGIVDVRSPVGPVALGSPTSAPSPLPTPYATPLERGNVPYFAVPVPTLSPATTYTVSYVQIGPANDPPSCVAPATVNAGSFTTR